MIRLIKIIPLLVFAFVNLSFADVVELPPTADVFVSEIVPNTNQNNWDFVNWGESSNYEMWGLIKFGGLSDYTGVSLNSAVLSVFIFHGDDYSTDENRLRRITGDWDEDTVTWNTRPAYTTAGELVFNDPPDDTWLDLDVTGFVQDWLDGTYPNYGFCFLRVDSINEFWQFYTKEYYDPDYHPKLTLDFPSPVESTILGAVKAAFK